MDGNKRLQQIGRGRQISWIPPGENVIKINVDGSYSTVSKSMSRDIAAKDANGDVKCCAVLKGKDKSSSLQCELEAILAGLTVATDKG
ncbi:hypothetical protein PTKIN_Ptkin17bG0048900 [Pterospermum kingtungense]